MSFLIYLFQSITPQGDGNNALYLAFSALLSGVLFQSITPQGDGNVTWNLGRTTRPFLHFQSITPQGDGNDSSTYIRFAFELMTFNPLPRKGTETFIEKEYTKYIVDFQSITPQGDRNLLWC